MAVEKANQPRPSATLDLVPAASNNKENEAPPKGSVAQPTSFLTSPLACFVSSSPRTPRRALLEWVFFVACCLVFVVGLFSLSDFFFDVMSPQID